MVPIRDALIRRSSTDRQVVGGLRPVSWNIMRINHVIRVHKVRRYHRHADGGGVAASSRRGWRAPREDLGERRKYTCQDRSPRWNGDSMLTTPFQVRPRGMGRLLVVMGPEPPVREAPLRGPFALQVRTWFCDRRSLPGPPGFVYSGWWLERSLNHSFVFSCASSSWRR